MSWGALNNQREHKSSDPLPDFLTEHNLKDNLDKHGHYSQSSQDVITQRPERPYTPRPDNGLRGYGVSYPRSVAIQMSRKTLFISMIFFMATILIAFSIGYAAGNMSLKFQDPPVKSIQIKKPIIPHRHKNSNKKNNKILEGGSLSSLSVAEDRKDAPASADTKVLVDNQPVSPVKNNKDNNESEVSDKEAIPAEMVNEVVE